MYMLLKHINSLS